jgi:hypothetical protein
LEAEIRLIAVRPAWVNISDDPMSKITKAKWTGGMGEVVE